MRRDIGLVGLLFTSVGSIIGSGWLFGALNASQLAGPAVIISWVVGGVVMLLLALVHAELGGMYPVAGGSARYPYFAFGGLVGFSAGWFAFLGAVTTAPIEVEAALQYATNYVHWLTKSGAGGTTLLTGEGYAVAAVLMLLFSFVNILGVKWLSETNKVTVWWKIAVPVIAIAALMISSFHASTLTGGAGHGGFMPFGFKGVLVAVAGGGVIFAYLGFEQAIQLGGESRNPRRNIPVAVIGSMILGVILYILLQIAFLVALDPGSLSKGWSQVVFHGKAETFGPFAGLATGLGLGWLAVLLYIDAIISPGGTGLLYTGTSSRLTFSLARMRFIPEPFARLSPRGVPLIAIAFSFLCGMVVFLPFPGWQQLVGFVSDATVLAYGMAPLALGALRSQDAERERPYRLPAAGILAPMAFVVANEVILFSGWAVVWKLVVAILIGFLLMGVNMLFEDDKPRLEAAAAWWLAPYLVGLAVISYLSSFDTKTPSRIPLLGLHGPRNDLPFGWDMVAMAAFSVVVYVVAQRTKLPAERTGRYIEELEAEAEAEDKSGVAVG
jgi:amino acid transporter